MFLFSFLHKKKKIKNDFFEKSRQLRRILKRGYFIGMIRYSKRRACAAASRKFSRRSSGADVSCYAVRAKFKLTRLFWNSSGYCFNWGCRAIATLWSLCKYLLKLASFQSVIFCGQFNTYLPFSLPAPAFCFYSLSLSYLFPTLWTKLRYSRTRDVFNAAHRTVFGG